MADKMKIIHPGMMTGVYHIYYTPGTKEASLMFWGCNMSCRGCYCKRRIYSPMLKDFVGANVLDDPGPTAPPNQFLSFTQIFDALDRLSIERVLLEGQEASIDPLYPEITRELHRRYSSYNVLLSNCLELPDLGHTDKVAIGLKAVTDGIHQEYTGVSNRNILKNIEALSRSGFDLVIESVYIPGLIDIGETENIASYIAGLGRDITYVILPYFKAGGNIWPRPTPVQMDEAACVARKHLTHVFHFRGDEQMQGEVLSIFPADIGHNAAV